MNIRPVLGDFKESETPRSPSAPSAEEPICPISQDIISNLRSPVFAIDGQIYERGSIHSWLREKRSSPYTRQQMNINNVYKNHSLDKLIDYIKTLRYKNQNLSERMVTFSEIIASLENVLQHCLEVNDAQQQAALRQEKTLTEALIEKQQIIEELKASQHQSERTFTQLSLKSAELEKRNQHLWEMQKLQDEYARLVEEQRQDIAARYKKLQEESQVEGQHLLRQEMMIAELSRQNKKLSEENTQLQMRNATLNLRYKTFFSNRPLTTPAQVTPACLSESSMSQSPTI